MDADEKGPGSGRPADESDGGKSEDGAPAADSTAPEKPAHTAPAPPPPARPAPPPRQAPPAAARPAPARPAATAPGGSATLPAARQPAAKPEDPQRKAVPNVPLELLKARFPEAIEEVAYFLGEVTAKIRKDRLVEVCRFLKDDSRARLDLLSDLSALDFPKDSLRFEINYHVYSVPHRHRIRIKIRLAEGDSIPTVSEIWATANWHEREAFDLFGITFSGHPDLTRILLPDDWKGHPLRKEYPLEGFPEQHPRYR